jgi:hypothetical protein
MSNPPPFPPPNTPPPGGPNNPYGNNPYGQNPYGNNPYNNPYGQNPMGMQRDVPNSTAILVLGIVSIVGCFCYGIIGLGCGIAALIMANKAMQEYNQNPSAFKVASYNNAKAGKICAIIGTILSSLYLIYVICIFAFLGTSFMGSNMWDRW